MEIFILFFSFTITMEFRALQPNGIMLYARSADSNPLYYIGLYMKDGLLMFSMNSQTGNVGSTTGLNSQFRYDDGKWWEVNDRTC